MTSVVGSGAGRGGRDAGETDPAERARFLARVRDATLAGTRPPGTPRPAVSASWRRSLAASVDPDRAGPPHLFDRAEIREMRGAHPLAEALPLLRHALVEVADEATHMMIVTDARGLILWCEGQADVMRLAEPVGLTEGTRWSEDSIGTNAMGTALAAGHPVQIHSAEHLVRTYHAWTCAASPVHDPDTGDVVGVVDVTGPARTFHPATLSLVSAAARLAESQLQLQMLQRDDRLLRRHSERLAGPGRALVTPSGRVLRTAAVAQDLLPQRVDGPAAGMRVTLADGTDAVLEPLEDAFLLQSRRRATDTGFLELSFLGAEYPTVRLGGRQLRLSLRHAEMVAVLALHPDGLSAEQLALAVYGESGNPMTARAEVHRLRVQLGANVVRAKPYRLQVRVRADFLDLRRALLEGRVRDAATAHRGLLLPRSDSLGVREEREALLAALRHAVLGADDVEALWTLAQSPAGVDDVELTERLQRVLPDADPRRSILAGRHERRELN